MSVGQRLKEERERLNKTQTDFAETVGVKKGAIIQWEKDATSPPVKALLRLSKIGLDAAYVVTGERLKRADPVYGDHKPDRVAAAHRIALIEDMVRRGVALENDLIAELRGFSADKGLGEDARTYADEVLRRTGDKEAAGRLREKLRLEQAARKDAEIMIDDRLDVLNWSPPASIRTLLIDIVADGIDLTLLDRLIREMRALSE